MVGSMYLNTISKFDKIITKIRHNLIREKGVYSITA